MNADPDEGVRPRRILLALVAGAVVLGVVLWLALRPTSREGSAAVPGSHLEHLTLVAPRGELESAPILFEWRPVEGARRYAVRIEDADAVWPIFVRTTVSTTLSLEPHEASALLAGRVHAWEVQAFDEEERVIASGGTRFRVRAPVPP